MPLTGQWRRTVMISSSLIRSATMTGLTDGLHGDLNTQLSLTRCCLSAPRRRVVFATCHRRPLLVSWCSFFDESNAGPGLCLLSTQGRVSSIQTFIPLSYSWFLIRNKAPTVLFVAISLLRYFVIFFYDPVTNDSNEPWVPSHTGVSSTAENSI